MAGITGGLVKMFFGKFMNKQGFPVLARALRIEAEGVFYLGQRAGPSGGET
jgi:hypothetical protein